MYVSAGHHAARQSEVKELLEVDLEIVQTAMNLVNANREDTMMSWD